MRTGLAVAGVLIALFALHRLALWAEARGWIYYRNAPAGAGSYALSHIDAIVRPEVEHVIELRDQAAELREVAGQGEPP